VTSGSSETQGEPDAVWLFGYGSLIWRPEVAYSARTPAILRGYQRRFWQRSTDHRGTAERPGRVVTLVPSAGSRVLGMAYRLVDPEATLARVDVREQQGYTRLRLPIELTGGHVAAVVYVADPTNPYFAGDEAIDHTAAVIATAHGPSGANLEYARALVAALAELATAPWPPGELVSDGPLSLADLAYEQELLARVEAQLLLAGDGVRPQ
jgi:cation transport regulator ChaC